MSVFLCFLAYFSVGLLLMGYVIGRYEYRSKYTVHEYLFLSLMWPPALLYLLFQSNERAADISPILRKVFGGSRKG